MSIKQLLIVLGVMPISVMAFKPGDSFATGGSLTHTHHTITQDKIRTINIDGKELTFEDDAMNEVSDANEMVDLYHLFDPKSHCDSEHIYGTEGCEDRIKSLKQRTVNALSQKKPLIGVARSAFGQLLHTVQDFYAHSNWVNLGNTTSNSKILDDEVKESDKAPKEREVDDPDKKTCEWETGVFDEKPLPKLQLGPRGKSVVTTGYFEALGLADPIHYKCDHGGKGTGLNKDTPSQNLYEKAASVAGGSTQDIYRDIINKVLASTLIDAETKAKNIAKFLGEIGNSNLGFVVDTTGSMGDTVTGIKSAMRQTVTKLQEEGKEIGNFYVLSFGDPGVGSVLSATDVDTMLANINSVQLGVPDGGGDYPEKALDGLMRVVNAAEENTELYLYTDAPTKNPGLAGSIISTAQAKNITINFFLSGSGDSAYTRIASATGGQIISYPHSVSGAEGTFALVNPALDGNLEKLLQITGVIPGKKSKSLALVRQKSVAPQNFSNTTQEDTKHLHEVTIPKARLFAKAATPNSVEHNISIDSSVEKVLVNIEMDPVGTITLIRPDGTEVQEGDARVTIRKTTANVFFSVENPEAGIWKVRISGSAGQTYSVSVNVVSPTHIVDLHFVELKGRPGHEGMFPIDGQPLSTSEQYILLKMSGEVDNLEMYLVGLDGKVLKTVDLHLDSKIGTLSEYYGKVYLPNEKFKILVKGTDSAGNTFERLYNQVYVGQTVSVKPLRTRPVYFQPGKKSTITFSVKNTSAKDTFILEATQESGDPITLETTEITLDANESAVVHVSFVVPMSADTKTQYAVTLKASSKTNAESSNFAQFIAEVDNNDLDSDGVNDTLEKNRYDGNGDGIADYNQSKVVTMMTAGGTVTLELSDNSSFRNFQVNSANKKITDSVAGEIPFGVWEYDVESSAATHTVKVYYANNLYPTAYYKYDESSKTWVEDTSVVFEKGSAAIQVASAHTSGFLLFNNHPPKAYVTKQEVNKNASIEINLLEHVLDEDGDAVRIFKVDTESLKHGSIEKIDAKEGYVRYSTPKDYNGTDYFSYIITDDKGGFKEIDVEIDIVNTNPYDVNGDGRVNFEDMRLVMRYAVCQKRGKQYKHHGSHGSHGHHRKRFCKKRYRKYDAQYDVNADGVINFRDVFEVWYHMYR